MHQVETLPGRPRVLEEDPRPWLELRRTLRWQQRQRQRTWRLELVGVLLVLLSSIPMAWWASSRLAVDLQGVGATLVALAPPRHQPEHRIVGYTGENANSSADRS